MREHARSQPKSRVLPRPRGADIHGHHTQQNSIAVHTSICQRLAQKTRAKRRGVFDSRTQRLTGDLAPMAPRRSTLERAGGGRGGGGGGGGSVSKKLGPGDGGVRIGAAPVGKSERTYTNWRQKRAELRQASILVRQKVLETRALL